MTREDLRKELMPLAPSSYEGKDFRTHLSTKLKEYSELISKLDENERPEHWTEIINFVQHLSDNIKEVVKRSYMGQHSLAYSLLRKRLDDLFNITDCYIKMPVMSFWRMRVFDSNTKEPPSYEGLFHIPFNKRGIVKTERYSTPGYPCLYLGLSSYVCWEEMKRPNLDKCYVSRFISNEEILCLDISYPIDAYWKKNSYFISCIMRYPLVIASMIKVNNNDDIFKPEYIIPQLMMEWVLEHQSKKDKNKYPIGVLYTSVHVNSGFSYHISKFNNLAIPAQSPFEGKYSKELSSLFMVSEPTSDEIEKAKGAAYNAENILIPLHKDASEQEKIQFNYDVSLFGHLERTLERKIDEYPLHSIIYK